MSQTGEYIETLCRQLGEHVFGSEPIVRLLAMARIARGHALLQGPPGVGKTFLARAFAGALGGQFRRVQGTPDLLPSDITGVVMFSPDGRAFEFRRGPLFADVVLVDEINRAGPKTQSALLEAMEERHVTIEGDTHPLPEDFIVLATQNPIEFEGTYPLPESQIDRFLVRILLDYPTREAEAQVLTAYGQPDGAHGRKLDFAVPAAQTLNAVRDEVVATRVEPELIGYVLDIVAASRRSDLITLGFSTRAARALLVMARINAAASGSSFVRPDDVQLVASAVLGHRLVLTAEAVLQGIDGDTLVARLIETVPVPRGEQSALAS